MSVNNHKNRPSNVPVLRRAAMDFLARREHSIYELKQKLFTKYPDSTLRDLQTALDELRRENLQSDRRFAECYVRYRKSKGFAYKHIRADLFSRGVHTDIVNDYLSSQDPDWQVMANSIIEKKIPNSNEIVYGSKQHRRLVRFLESRGFLLCEIQEAVYRNRKLIST